MNDTPNSDAPSSGRKTLTLKRTEQGTVRQSFSHGRSKAVVVEKKKRRLNKPGQTPSAEKAAPVVETKAPKRSGIKKAKAPTPKDDSTHTRTLTNEEQEARLQALKDAEIRQKEEAKQRAAEEAKLEKIRQEALEKAPLLEEKANNEKRSAPKKNIDAKKEEASSYKKSIDDKGEDKSGKGRKSPSAPKATPRNQERRRGKLTIAVALNDDGGESGRARSLAALRRRQEKAKRAAAQQNSGPREKVSREVQLPEVITIQELANRMAERAVDVIKLLMQQGQMVKITDVIDLDTAELIAEEMGHTVKRVAESDVEEGLFASTEEDDEADLTPRSPVVTIMGHVDHGKTSLLDAIRNASVASGEAGGITQHIGAYQVEKNNQKITFLDTPGHEAFTAMRARGAKVTDLVILVVAADDSVMPTTIEAINHTQAAGVPLIVAINKMDKPEANPDRVRTDLLQHNIIVESMGGEVMDVEVSAKKGTNLDGLLEAILLQSEILELKANADCDAEGIVVESQLDKGRGSVATVIVQRGTLKQGDILVAGTEWARVRALIDDKGKTVKEAGPSVPVEILGFQGTPSAGDPFAVVSAESRAREITEYRVRQKRDKAAVVGGATVGSIEQMMNRLQTDKRSEVPLIIKSDVQGSAEAIVGALEKMSTDEVGASIIHSAAGGVTESDIVLANASKASIIAFNVRANKQAKEAAEREGVSIRYYNVIYDLVDDVKAVMSGMLAPEQRETFLGYADILEVFNISKVGKVAGCRVSEGKVERGSGVRLLRDDVVIHQGKLSTLKRFKDEVREVNGGQECGMAFENYQDMRAGDVIECYRVEEIERTLD